MRIRIWRSPSLRAPCRCLTSSDHVARIRCRIWCRTRSHGIVFRASSGTLPKRRVQVGRPARRVSSLLHNRDEFSSSGAANSIILGPTSPHLRLSRTAVGPIEQHADVGDDVESPAISYIELDGIASYSFTASINETARVRSLRCRP